MDFILFIKIIVWLGLVGSGLLTALSIYSWYYYECTKSGEFEQQLMATKGQRIISYGVMPRAIVFIICLAAIISFN